MDWKAHNRWYADILAEGIRNTLEARGASLFPQRGRHSDIVFAASETFGRAASLMLTTG
jgi:hypothetical protein